MIDPQKAFQFESLKVESSADFVSARWKVPNDLPYLNGHFPNQPVVPAVAIIDAALELLKSAGAAGSKLKRVKNAKFTAPLLPGQTVEIEAMKIIDQEWTIDFKDPATATMVARLLLVL